MENQNVDFQAFNAKISSYQIEEFNFEALGLSDPVVCNEEAKKEVVLNEESCLYVEEYLNLKHTLDLSLVEKQKLLKYNNSKENFIKDVELFLNYMISSNIETDSLINLVGYARARNIFMIIFQSHSYVLNNDYEKLIVKEGFHFGLAKSLIKNTQYADCINCQQNDKCSFHLSSVFTCSICLGVNCHKDIRGPKRMSSPCGGYLEVYDEFGKFTCTNENGLPILNPQKILCYGQEFNINDNVILRNIEKNIKKINELSSNYETFKSKGVQFFDRQQSVTLDDGRVVQKVNFSFSSNDELQIQRSHLGIFLHSETYHKDSVIHGCSINVVNNMAHLIYGINSLTNSNFVEFDKHINDRINVESKKLLLK